MKPLNDSQAIHANAIQRICLSDAVHQALEDYFQQMNGHRCQGLYGMVLSEVEKPLLRCVMAQCDGNQSQAAKMLGINRATLRKKLQLYGLSESR